MRLSKKSQQYLSTKEPVQNMKAFAAACLISLSHAFSIAAIDSIDVKDVSDSKNLLKGIPQLEAAPAFDKVDGF